MSESKQHTIEYGSTVIMYEVNYSERETLAIHVHPDTTVSVDAPMESELAEIEKRVRKRAAWILRQQRNFRRYSGNFPPRKYLSGETYRYLGQQVRLKVVQSQDGKENVQFDREYLTVTTRRKEDSQHTKELLDRWYREQALAVYKERAAVWFPHFERLGLSQPEITTRQMRSRWGNCGASGKITFNTKLVMVHKHLIDYVVVHELCHLKEHNHRAGFHNLLSRIMPDWKERKEKLDRFDFS